MTTAARSVERRPLRSDDLAEKRLAFRGQAPSPIASLWDGPPQIGSPLLNRIEFDLGSTTRRSASETDTEIGQ
jgi:hypothetical protein